MAVNTAYINNDATWHKMTIEQLNFDYYNCCDNLKKAIKAFYIDKIEKGYLFTTDIECTEVDYDGFEHFVAYKEKEEHNVGQIKTWYQYEEDICNLFSDDDDDDW